MLWFWLGVGLVSLLLAYGRFAPFYRVIYALPYFSTIRNPVKFLHVFAFSLVVLFAYGVDGLWRRYMQPAGPNTAPRWAGLKAWWARATRFEKRWVLGCVLALGASLLAWLAYASSRQSLEQYLQTVQFDEAKAHAIAGFSIGQVGWFVLFFVLAAGLMLLIFSGGFAGARARWGAVLLGLLLVVDLGRANQPWVVYWDYQEKYASNPIIDRLREKPYEHRVTMLPFHRAAAVCLAGPGLSRPVAEAPVPVLQHPVARYRPDAAHAGGRRGLREGFNRAGRHEFPPRHCPRLAAHQYALPARRRRDSFALSTANPIRRTLRSAWPSVSTLCPGRDSPEPTELEQLTAVPAHEWALCPHRIHPGAAPRETLLQLAGGHQRPGRAGPARRPVI